MDLGERLKDKADIRSSGIAETHGYGQKWGDRNHGFKIEPRNSADVQFISRNLDVCTLEPGAIVSNLYASEVHSLFVSCVEEFYELDEVVFSLGATPSPDLMRYLNFVSAAMNAEERLAVFFLLHPSVSSVVQQCERLFLTERQDWICTSATHYLAPEKRDALDIIYHLVCRIPGDGGVVELLNVIRSHVERDATDLLQDMIQSFDKDGLLKITLNPDVSMVEDDDHNEGAPDLSCLISFLCGVEHKFHGYSRHFPRHQPLHDKVSLQGWKTIVNSVAHIAELLASHSHYLLSREESKNIASSFSDKNRTDFSHAFCFHSHAAGNVPCSENCQGSRCHEHFSEALFTPPLKTPGKIKYTSNTCVHVEVRGNSLFYL
jgi:hypothetical protein